MARLRGPMGCPWDREQTLQSIRQYTLEEVYEVFDAIERGSPEDLCEELGDLLLQVLFYAQMSQDVGGFSIADVLVGLNRKLIRRHPHVFGEQASAAAGNRALVTHADQATKVTQVLANWSEIKSMEKIEKQPRPAQRGASRLADVLRTQPAMLEASKLGSAAAKCGFDWPDARGLLDKLREEAAEVEAEMADGAAQDDLRMELGDLLFVAANLARYLKVDPEMALRDANLKFRTRFEAMEACEQTDGGPALEERSLEELEQLWQHAKHLEKEESDRILKASAKVIADIVSAAP